MIERRRLLQGGLGLVAVGCSSDPAAGPTIVTPAGLPALSKEPYVQRIGATAARLRFETRVEEALTVRVRRAAGDVDLEPSLSPREVTYRRDFLAPDPNYFPDEPGLHVLQEVVIDDLAPGEEVAWEVLAETTTTGSFLASPAPDVAVRLGWLADTSWPMSQASADVLAAEAPDVFLHGGDIQYQSNPLDTWRGMTRCLAPITGAAMAHFIVGNHEFEDGDEIEQMYDRLFLGQGDGMPTSRHFAFGFGGLHLLCLDTETNNLADDAAQLAWLDAQLDALGPDVRQAIIAFHRPVYSLSKHSPGSTATRDAIHQRCLEHGVRLVLCGHAHCYERFEVDDVTYVVDGGGGSLLYDVNEGLEETEMLRPGESDLRVAVSESRGGLRIDLTAAGTLEVARLEAEGGVSDAFTISSG